MNRKEQAVAYFYEGFNCAQAVFMAYADAFGLEADMAQKIAASMGGGMGGLRSTCGAATAMFLLAGLKYGAYEPDNQEAKKALYALVQKMDAAFCAAFGTDNCKELLAHAKVETSPIPKPRTPGYYAERPCARFVAGAADIIEACLLQELGDVSE